jgi:cation:H+ antiporter
MGLALIGLTLVMVGDSVWLAINCGTGAEDLGELEEIDPEMAPWKIAFLILVGLIGLPVGADLLIRGATEIAMVLGVSETVIGLTLVAIGTSLPELATTLMAALRLHSAVAIGNVVGSNIFNITAIIGAAALVGPLPVPGEILTRDLWVMIGASVLLIPFILFSRPIGRLAGAGMLLLYAIYLHQTFG